MLNNLDGKHSDATAIPDRVEVLLGMLINNSSCYQMCVAKTSALGNARGTEKKLDDNVKIEFGVSAKLLKNEAIFSSNIRFSINTATPPSYRLEGGTEGLK